jgi:hypothetical protein
MKRKLSLAVAFCGGSKVVFLDEVRFKTIFAINAHHNHHLTQVFSQQAEWTLLAGDLFGMLFVKTVKIDALSLLPISWMRQTCLVIVLELWQKVT